MIQLVGTDDCSIHVVTTKGKEIYDPNFGYTLSLTPASLDLCVPGHAGFKRVARAIRVIPSKKANRRMVQQ